MKQFLRFHYFLLLYNIYFPLVIVSKIPSGFNVYITPKLRQKLRPTAVHGRGVALAWRYCNYTSSCRSNFDRHKKKHKHLLQFNECKECKSMVVQVMK